ncbi:MAG: ABC transporter substrate-binding protein [Geminicoccaceae bacterium]
MPCRWMIAVATVLALVGATGEASAQEKVFRYATTGDILGLDPHSNNEGPTNAIKANVYGRLIHRAPDLSLEPDLAVSWTNRSDTLWEFKLREGVTFHNGSPFNADDVVYSFKRQTQPEAQMAFALSTVADVRKIDDFTVEIETRGPDPVLLLNMPNFYIVDREFTEDHDAFEIVGGAGRGNFINQHANGTGPFRLVEWVPDDRVVLEPFENWWNQNRRTDNVDRAIYRPIGNDTTRMAALLSGEIDLAYPIPLQDIDRIGAEPNVQSMRGPELRTIFLGFDQHRDELLDMPGTGRNPFKDVRVRRAVAHAIDIEAIHRVVMRGASTPTGLMVAPGVNGFSEDLNTPYAYDPARAKELLAEAGYAQGFPVTLDCPNDRYVNDEAICTAIVPMLRRVGIDVALNAQSKSLIFNKVGASQGYDTSFFLLGWTPGTFDSYDVIQNIMTLDGEARGTWNCGRYTNPQIERLADRIAVTIDADERVELIHRLFALHKDDVGHLPLHQQALSWGVRTDTVESVQQRPFDDVDLRTVVLR